MDLLLNILWFIWEFKYILFWIYLWQLKSYHTGRFIDHFRTHQGKKLLFNVGQILKLLLVVLLFYKPLLLAVLGLSLIYLVEFVFIIRAFSQKSIKKPVATAKAIFLTLVSCIVLVLFFFKTAALNQTGQLQSIVLFDIFTPLIVSCVVLLFQPAFVALRNITLQKASKKLENIKKNNGLKVVAITGSYGKTSTKEFLYTILASKYKVLKTEENQNSEIGIANQVLQNLTSEHQFFIAEVGAYNKGKIKEVCSFLHPDIGIVTGVNAQHLSLFGSMKNLLLAEGGGELEASLPADGVLIVNGDNKYCLDLYKRSTKNKKLYAQNNTRIDADIFTEVITADKYGISFVALDKQGRTHHFSAKVLGKHNVSNLLAAIVAALQLGMSFEDISQSCEHIVPEQTGMTLKEGKYGIQIIDSSYSANPDGVYADVDYLSLFLQKRVIIMPSLIELGERSSEIHRAIGQKISKVCDMIIITTKDKFDDIKKGAMEAGLEEKNIVFCENPDDIYSIVTTFCKAGDAVLLEGRVPTTLIKMLQQ